MSNSRESALPPIVLASSSPRRREIMQGVENIVDVFRSDMDEGPRLEGESAEEYVYRLSREKAEHSIAQGASGTILTADTTVAIDDDILGKPRTKTEARQMLEMLKGRVHHVVTGVTVCGTNGAGLLSSVRSTSVHVREYSESEMEDYLNSGTPMDRAGAYGVQDAPFNPVTKVNGCYLNVVGLPMCTVVTLMAKVGTNLKLRPSDRVPYLDRCGSCELGRKEDR